jgi:hypothetical protein
MSVADIAAVLASGSVLAAGLLMAFVPGRFQRDRLRDYDRQLAARLERGHDAYFEELRTIKAYRKPLEPHTIRFFGGLLAVLAAANLVFRFA